VDTEKVLSIKEQDSGFVAQLYGGKILSIKSRIVDTEENSFHKRAG
jgi:hypothetical protein